MSSPSSSQSGPTALGRSARDLVRGAITGSLASRYEESNRAWPYTSLVLTAFDMTGAPLFLLSDLALHTKNLRRDAKASLLIEDTAGLEDPLVGARVTLIGEVTLHKDGRDEERFCRRHPSSAIYRDFKDFHLFRMKVERAHLVAGFGQIHWIEAKDLLLEEGTSAELGQAETEIVQHMNDEHRDAVRAIATQKAGEGAWVMTGLDSEGADFRDKGNFCRVSFPGLVKTAHQARTALVRLTRKARTKGSAG